MGEQTERLCTICQHSGYDHLSADRLGGCNVSDCDCEQYNLPSVGLWAGVTISDLAHLLELSTTAHEGEGEQSKKEREQN